MTTEEIGINGWDAPADAVIDPAYAHFAPPVWAMHGATWYGLPTFVSIIDDGSGHPQGGRVRWCYNDVRNFTQAKLYAAQARMNWMNVPKPWEIKDENDVLIWKPFPPAMRETLLAMEWRGMIDVATASAPWDAIQESNRLKLEAGVVKPVGGAAGYAAKLKALQGTMGPGFHHGR